MAFAQQSEQELPAAEEEFLVTEEGGQREQSGILRGSKHLRVPIGIGVVAVLAVIACLASSAGLTSSRGRSQSSGGLTSSRRRSQSSGSQSGHSFGFVGLAKGGKEDDDGGKGRRRRHNHPTTTTTTLNGRKGASRTLTATNGSLKRTFSASNKSAQPARNAMLAMMGRITRAGLAVLGSH